MLPGCVFLHRAVVTGFIRSQRRMTYPSRLLSCQPPWFVIQVFVVTVPNLACWGIPNDPYLLCCAPSYQFPFLTRERILSCGFPTETGGYLSSRLSFLEWVQPNSQPRLSKALAREQLDGKSISVSPGPLTTPCSQPCCTQAAGGTLQWTQSQQLSLQTTRAGCSSPNFCAQLSDIKAMTVFVCLFVCFLLIVVLLGIISSFFLSISNIRAHTHILLY